MNFKILDYDTSVGIDFVTEDALGNPKYVELKGELIKQVNHPFSCIHKFICYDTHITKGEVLVDKEETEMEMAITQEVEFSSPDKNFNKKKYTFHRILPTTPKATSIEVICLKKLLEEVIGATIS